MNPIQQAISALEESGAWAPGVGRAMDILRSLQKEVEGVELPDPKYIYHNSEMPGEDELFEFVDSGAVDEDCPNCERLYTADQLRTAVAAALGRGAVPSGWKLVPVEPTPEMRKAAADAWLDCDSKLFLNKAGAAVRAAIAISKESA